MLLTEKTVQGRSVEETSVSPYKEACARECAFTTLSCLWRTTSRAWACTSVRAPLNTCVGVYNSLVSASISQTPLQ